MHAHIKSAFAAFSDARVIALGVGFLSGQSGLCYGWPGGLSVFATGTGLLMAAQWIRHDAARVIAA